jgi:uncharacterized protein (DUF433 family)
MAVYVELRDEDYMLMGSRVSLASLVMQWREGKSAESIQKDFPTLSLEQVYGAIAYYLANQTQVDSYLEELSADFEKRASEARAANPILSARLLTAIHSSHR